MNAVPMGPDEGEIALMLSAVAVKVPAETEEISAPCWRSTLTAQAPVSRAGMVPVIWVSFHNESAAVLTPNLTRVFAPS